MAFTTITTVLQLPITAYSCVSALLYNHLHLQKGRNINLNRWNVGTVVQQYSHHWHTTFYPLSITSSSSTAMTGHNPCNLPTAKCSDDIGAKSKCLGLTLLSSLIIAVLLIIGGIEQNPGPSGEMDSTASDMYGVWKTSEVRHSVWNVWEVVPLQLRKREGAIGGEGKLVLR